MSQCKLDHSLDDVEKKLSEQKEYLPSDIYNEFTSFLEKDLAQGTLNEAFHLLKKYDLSEKDEQKKRNNKMKELFKQ